MTIDDQTKVHWRTLGKAGPVQPTGHWDSTTVLETGDPSSSSEMVQTRLSISCFTGYLVSLSFLFIKRGGNPFFGDATPTSTSHSPCDRSNGSTKEDYGDSPTGGPTSTSTRWNPSPDTVRPRPVTQDRTFQDHLRRS